MPERDATLDAFISPEPDEDEESKAVEDGEEPQERAESAEPTEAEEVEEAGEPVEGDEEGGSETATDESAETATNDAPWTNTDDPVTERAESTFSWSPAGGECAACGEQARRRWRTDAGYVCHGCVDWDRAPER